MAKKEKIYDNTKLETALKKVSYDGLTSEATLIINKTIQECKSLGKYKLPVKDIFYIVKHATELSKVQVEYYLSLTRSDEEDCNKRIIYREVQISLYRSSYRTG
ncbi:hypothetical protein FCI58_20095 [Enterobacter hormaechei]|nr:hypothetical protein [Enterobacter hormaechei]